MEEIIIRIKGDAKDIDNLIKQLEKTKEADNATAKEFAKNNEQFKKQQKEKSKAVAESSASINNSLNSINNQIANIGKGIVAAFALQNVINFGIESAKLAAKVEGVKIAFDRLDNPNLLGNLQKAVKGTVSDFDLMKAAVQASSFKVPLEQLPKLFEFAARRAKDTGQSVDYLVESIILGIGRKSPLILDNLGISAVSLREKFNGLSAEAAGVGDVARAVGEIATEELAKMGAATNNNIDRIQRLTATWENFKVKAGDAVLKFTDIIVEGTKKWYQFLFVSDNEKTVQAFLDKQNEKMLEFISQMDKLNATKKEDNKLTEAQIRNVYFLKKEIEAQTDIINSQNSSIKDINIAVKEKAKLEKELALLTQTENEAMKKQNELLAKRKDALESLIKKESELSNTLLTLRAKSEFEIVAIEKKAQEESLKILFDKTDKGEKATKVYNDALLDIYLISEQKINGILDKKWEEEDKKRKQSLTEYQKYLDDLADAEKEAFKKNKQSADKQFDEREQRQKDAIDSGFAISAQSIATLQQLNDAALQNELMVLEDQLEKKQITQEQFDQKAKIAKQKAAEENKKFAIFNILLSTAQAVIGALAMVPPNPVLAITAGVVGALQLAAAASTPVPQFKEGTEYLKLGRNKPGIDTIPILANEGEAIIPTDKNKKYPGMAAAWIRGNLDDYINTKFIMPNMNKKQSGESFAEKMAKAISQNSGFYDGNLLSSDKSTRALIKEQTEVLKRVLNKNNNSRYAG